MTEKMNSNKSQRLVRRVRQTQQNPNIPNKKVKQWAKAWWKWLLIWMWLFVFFIILLIFIFFFYLTSHPGAAKWIGIPASTIKSITSVFAGLVFGTLFVIFLILWLSYLYKLATKKENKTRNLIGTIVVFILWMTNIVFWWLVFSKIAKIQVDNVINTNDILIANYHFMNTSMKEKIIPSYKNAYPLIWPTVVSFQFNSMVYKTINKPALIRKYWYIKEKKFILDCWNGQTIIFPVHNNKLSFSQYDYCLYLKKTSPSRPYKAKLRLYFDTKTQRNLYYDFTPKDIFIKTNVLFKSKYTLNDDKNEIIIGERWDEIKLDITKIPEDLWLENNTLEIDFEWNWNFKKYEWLAKYIYKKDWAYKVVIRIPNEPQAPYYYFPVRVKPSTKPTCDISVKEKFWKYYFIISTHKVWAPIRKVEYILKDITNNDKTIVKWKGTHFRYSLKDGSSYQLVANIEDTNKKKWTCTSELIDLSNKFKYKFDVSLNWKKLNWTEVKVSKLPFKYKLEISNIEPNNDNISIWYDLDNDGEIDEMWDTYEWKISSKSDKEITLIVKDAYWNIAMKKIKFVVDLQPIIVDLQVKPDIWEAPLKVRFDASASEVTDPDDKIVYFNWDFGDDSKPITLSSQWVVTHTYKKKWEYTAKVTIRTKKWYEISKVHKVDVTETTNSANITFPNNAGGNSVVWAPVKMKVNTSWNVKKIEWNFGDGTPYSCSGRECESIAHSYQKDWVYKVTAKIYYMDNSPVVTVSKRIAIIKN